MVHSSNYRDEWFVEDEIMAASGVGGSERSEGLEGLVEVLKVLAHPMRLQILQWLRDPRGEFPVERGIADPDEYGICVSQITDKAKLAQSTISSFMRSLEREGLVVSTRVGKWTHYRRNEERINEVREALLTAL